MGRSLLHGASLVLFVSLFVLVFASWAPMWLAIRTELSLDVCWTMQGLYNSAFFWGADLPDAKLKCSLPRSPPSHGPFSPYCQANSSSSYAHDLCMATRRAKITSSMAIVLSTAAWLIVLLQSWQRRRQRATCAGSSSGIRLAAMLASLVLCVASTAFSIATCAIMAGSPLFSSAHIAALDKAVNTGPRKLQLFSCSMQTLIKFAYAPVFVGSAPMECTFPGPSTLAMMVHFICQMLGGSFLVFIINRERQGGGGGGGDGGGVLPAAYHNVRTYSLYGATLRRFSHLPFLSRIVLCTALPFCTVIGNAATWMAYVLIGIEIIINVRVSITPNSKLSSDQQQQLRATIAASYNSSTPTTSSFIFLNVDTSFGPLTLFDVTLNPFNFSPMTSIYFFAEVGANLIAVGVFVAIFVLPICKVVLWIWLFYAPVHEATRGQWLIRLDFVGKYSLSALVLLILIAVSLVFKSNFIVIPLSLNESFLVRARAGINAGKAGSYMFVSFSMLSLLIGQVMVQCHVFACGWEEDRRSKMGRRSTAAVTTTAAPGSSSLVSTGGSTSLGSRRSSATSPPMDPSAYATSPATLSLLQSQSPVYDDLMIDTPSIRPLSGTAVAAPSALRSRLPASLATSLVDLSNLVQSHHQASFSSSATAAAAATRPTLRGAGSYDILRALSKYGSRAALQVLDSEEEEEGNHNNNNNRAAAAVGVSPILEEELDYESGSVATTTGTTSAAFTPSPRRRIGRVGVGGGGALSSLSSMYHSSQLHLHVEAMCDRVHSPEHGVQLKFTPAGKTLMWFLVFFAVALILICQTVPLIQVHETGAVGDWVVEPRDRYRSYSLVSLATGVAATGYEVPAYELSSLLFLMTAVMPVLTAWALAMLWGVPMTLERQEQLFNWLEIASAWSSLDILLLSIAAVKIEVEAVMAGLVYHAVPNMAELVRWFLPFEDGVLDIKMRLEFGFWILLAAVVAEKIALYLITENAVQAISERKLERFLTEIATHGTTKQKDYRRQRRVVHAATADDVNGAAAATPDDVKSPGAIDGLVADATEGLLESDAIQAFAPAGRYMSAQWPHIVYAGLPRAWWAKWGVRAGLLADAREVDYFSRTGRSLHEDLMQQQQQQQEHELEEQQEEEGVHRSGSTAHAYSSLAEDEHEEEEEEEGLRRQHRRNDSEEDDEGFGPISF